MIVFTAIIVLAGAWVLLLLRVDPVPTWFYVFAWYPTLIVLDRVGTGRIGPPARRHGSAILGWNGTTLSLLFWSAVIWLVFEALNLRLLNWYYVFLPRHSVERWVGILVSFATVVPAVILASRLLDRLGVGHRWQGQPHRVGSRDLVGAQLLGMGTLALAMVWPRTFFPLVWGSVWLLFDPYVYNRRPEWSLFADIERGDWGRIGRILLGGLGIGLLWEFYNFWAQGKWIYTVPWLEHTKLFEMPPLGFLGFPFFALEAWALYHALCVAGVAIPPEGRANVRRKRLWWTVALAGTFVAAIMIQMERRTISSTAPAPEALWDLGTDEVELITLRGIGVRHADQLRALGIDKVCDLARLDPHTLWNRLHASETDGLRPTLPEVRVWVGAAQGKCE